MKWYKYWVAYWWTVILKTTMHHGPAHLMSGPPLVRYHTWAAIDPPSTSCLFSQDSISHSHHLPNRFLFIDCLKQCELKMVCFCQGVVCSFYPDDFFCRLNISNSLWFLAVCLGHLRCPWWWTSSHTRNEIEIILTSLSIFWSSSRCLRFQVFK